MTSLNTTTGYDANKKTGSNLTRTHTQKRGGAVSGRDEGLSLDSSHVTPYTPSSTTASSSSSKLLTPGGGGVGGLGSRELTTDPPNDLEVMRQRELFFRVKYDPMTGVRIASTLGGFFLIVLLTLLYKSKCKGKHSREGSTLTLTNIGYPIHPGHLMRGQNIQVNGLRDFGGGMNGSGGGGSQNPMSLTLLDSTCYGYMNQVHPANSHQPMFSNCYGGTEGHVKSPAVLLITTAANSESSDEEMFLDEGQGNVGLPECGTTIITTLERKRSRNPLTPLAHPNKLKSSTEALEECQFLHPRSKSPPVRIGAKGNIDINVILPTPSISPSGSENFNMASGPYFGGVENGSRSNPPNLTVAARAPASGSNGRGDKRTLLLSRSLSSDNENDPSEEYSGCGGDLSESSEVPLAFGCGNFSLFSLDNLKYVDDTSSENIPTRASDLEAEDQDQDTRSIGSDSVFACFDHNFDHIAPTYARRVSSVSGTSSGVLGQSPLPLRQNTNKSIAPPPPPAPPPGAKEVMKMNSTVQQQHSAEGEEHEPEFRVTLTQAHAQVHHRDSFCSDLDSVNDYMETGARRRSSSTQTTLSDLRHTLSHSLGWSGGDPPPTEAPRRLSVPRRRRSLSPHMNHHNLLSPTSQNNSTAPLLSITLHPPPSSSTSAAVAISQPPPPPTSLPIQPEPCVVGDKSDLDGMTPATPTNPPVNMMLSPTSAIIPPQRMMRKRSFEAVRKSLSLQYEDKVDASSMHLSSSNETTPTN